MFSGTDVPEPFLFDTDGFHNGLLHFRATIATSGGGSDATEIGLLLDNTGNPLSDPN